MPTPLVSADNFLRIRTLAHARWGLDINPGKLELINGRMSKLLRQRAGETVDSVLDQLERGGDAALDMQVFDVLSTNLTSFFREREHFDSLDEHVIQPLVAAGGPRRLRLWSAACSKGCEPYTMAMVLRDRLPDPDTWDVRILATDLAQSVVEEARRGIYKANMVEDLHPDLVRRHFQTGQGDFAGHYRVRPELRRMVTFGLVNLIAPWPHQGPFDAVFCRNVMIYFDEPTRRALVERLRGLLRPGGMLYLGSSESLSEVPGHLQRVQPAAYRAA